MSRSIENFLGLRIGGKDKREQPNDPHQIIKEFIDWFVAVNPDWRTFFLQNIGNQHLFAGRNDLEIGSKFIRNLVIYYDGPSGEMGDLFSLIERWSLSQKRKLGGVQNIERIFIVSGWDYARLKQEIGKCFIDSCMATDDELV